MWLEPRERGDGGWDEVGVADRSCVPWGTIGTCIFFCHMGRLDAGSDTIQLMERLLWLPCRDQQCQGQMPEGSLEAFLFLGVEVVMAWTS